MESKPKTGNTPKRSNRKCTVKNDNFDDKGNGKNLHAKLTLKRRGLYVERNPEKLTIDEVFERATSSKSSQRECPSSILTSSIVGNRKSFIHEEIKTKRRVRKRNSVIQKAVAKCKEKVDLPNSRDRTKTKVSKEDMKDVVYVLQSNRRRGLSTSDSFRSKGTLEFDDSMISLKNDHNSNIPSSLECGIDRIAAQILQGWMTDREVSTKPQHLNKSEGRNQSLHSTALTGSNMSLRKLPSKDEKPRSTVLNSGIKKITFDMPNHTDTPRVPSGQFRITERETRKSDKEAIRKVPRVKAKPVRPKFNRLRAESRTYKAVDRTPRKNAKEFLNIIKRELEKCGSIPEEPRSMFDALKMVARNKYLFKRRISSYLSDTDCELQSTKPNRSKLYSNRLKSNSLECPIDSQIKKRRRKKAQRTL